MESSVLLGQLNATKIVFQIAFFWLHFFKKISNAVNAVTRAEAWTDGRQVPTACATGGCDAWALEGLCEAQIPPVSSGDVALAISTKHIAYNITFKLYTLVLF